MSARRSRLGLYTLVGVIFLLGLGHTIYRHLYFDVPLLPDQPNVLWNIEARVEFVAAGKEVEVTLARPPPQPGFTRLSETGASVGYGLSLEQKGPYPVAVWTKRRAQGPQQLYFRIQVMRSHLPWTERYIAPPPPSRPEPMEEPFATAAEALLDEAYARSADPSSMARQLIDALGSRNPDQNARLLLDGFPQVNMAERIARLLQLRDVPAASIQVLLLDDGRRRQTLRPFLSVWSDDEQTIFPLGLSADEAGLPYLIWQATGGSILDLTGGRRSRVTFSMARAENRSFGTLARSSAARQGWWDFSIYSLPIAEQTLFKTILLLPIGALIVCVLRILVGIRTSGTFMPVLIALALIQTQLLTGLVGFLLVVSAGLLIRGLMSRLHLLLVARISVVIIVVIGIIAFFTVVSFQMGLFEGLKITLFPMIILAWTVERMSVLWEEEGAREVMIQGGGSLATAVLAYLAMTNAWVQHWTFNYMGVQLIVLALVMLIGNYNGYRLTELRRFHAMFEK